MKNDQQSKQLQETSALPCSDRKGAFWPRKSAEGGGGYRVRAENNPKRPH